jgi:hypothetical protein
MRSHLSDALHILNTVLHRYDSGTCAKRSAYLGGGLSCCPPLHTQQNDWGSTAINVGNRYGKPQLVSWNMGFKSIHVRHGKTVHRNLTQDGGPPHQTHLLPRSCQSPPYITSNGTGADYDEVHLVTLKKLLHAKNDGAANGPAHSIADPWEAMHCIR